MAKPVIPLHKVFESALFIVVANDDAEAPCYEVVNIPDATSCFLHGAPARELLAQTQAWQLALPSEAEVEDYLSNLTFLNSHRMAVQ